MNVYYATKIKPDYQLWLWSKNGNWTKEQRLQKTWASEWEARQEVEARDEDEGNVVYVSVQMELMHQWKMNENKNNLRNYS